MNKLWTLAVCLLCFVNVACVTTQRFDETYRERVQRVTVHISDLPEFSYYGPKQALANGIVTALTGTIGSQPITGASETDDAKFKAAFKRTGFDPRETIVRSFSEKLHKKLGIVVDDSGSPDAEVFISVLSFGLGKGWGFADKTKPTMRIVFEMKDPAKQHLIWREIVLIETTTDESAYYSYEEWLSKQDTLKSEFMKSIDLATDRAVEKL